MLSRSVLFPVLFLFTLWVPQAAASADVGSLTPCSELTDAFAQHREPEIEALIRYEFALIRDFDGQMAEAGDYPPILPRLNKDSARKIGFNIGRVCQEHPDYTVQHSTHVVYDAVRMAELANTGHN